MASRFVRLLILIALIGLLMALFILPVRLSTHANTPSQSRSATQSTLLFAPWWNGSECDNTRYSQPIHLVTKGDLTYSDKGAGTSSYPVKDINGNIIAYDGIEVCAPRPAYDNVPDVYVKFVGQSAPQFEWECTELVMRYLYQVYNVAPYAADGKDVVSNFPINKYPGVIKKVQNDGKSPLPKAGDILSYDDNAPSNKAGHTSIVTGQVLNKRGQVVGINVIQQNSEHVTATLAVQPPTSTPSGTIKSFPYGKDGKYLMKVSRWLHVLSSSPSPTPTPSTTPIPSPTQPSTLTFTTVSSPAPGFGSTLLGVVAITPSNAWAVGSYDTTTSTSIIAETLTEHWNGTNWSIVPSPNPGNNQNGLAGVAAVSANDIWAVGSYKNITSSSVIIQPIIEHWDGTNWSIIPSPNPSPSNGNYIVDWSNLSGVAAVSADNVWAVGSYEESTSSGPDLEQKLLEHWDGNSWSILPSPSTDTNESLAGVGTVSLNDVWAVGSSVEHWDGTSWTNTLGIGGTGIAIVSANDIWAVGGSGQIISGKYITQPLTEHWNGTKWSIIPNPSTTCGCSLVGVAAISSNDVWAIGNGDAYTLIEHWDGTSWSIIYSGINSSNDSGLFGASADSANDVWVVGSNSARTWIEHGQ